MEATPLSRPQQQAIAQALDDYAADLRKSAATAPTQPMLVSHDDVAEDAAAWAARIRAGDPYYLRATSSAPHTQEAIAQAFDDFAARYRSSDQDPSPTVPLNEVAIDVMSCANRRLLSRQ